MMREYTVIRGGVAITVLLTDEDAKRLGAVPVEEPKERTPENKGRRPATK